MWRKIWSWCMSWFPKGDDRWREVNIVYVEPYIRIISYKDCIIIRNTQCAAQYFYDGQYYEQISNVFDEIDRRIATAKAT